MYKRSRQLMKSATVVLLSAATLWGTIPTVAQGPVNVDTSGAGTNVTVVGGSTSIQVSTSGGSGQTNQSSTSSSTGQTNRSSAQKDRCGNRYVPFVAGAQWKYQTTGAEDARFTRTLVSVSGGKADVRDAFESPADEPERSDQWQCRNGAIVTSAPSTWADVQDEGMSIGAVVASEGVTLPANPKPGDKWSQSARYGGSVQVAGQDIGGETQIKTNCRAVRVESVTVPAGKFNALRVDCTQEIKVKAGVAGVAAAEVPVTIKYSDWYAPGVGLIKTFSEEGSTVLLSYRLP